MSDTRTNGVTFVIGTAASGGAEGQLVRLASELTQRGFVVNVLFTGAGGPLTRVLDRYAVPWEVLNRSKFPIETVQAILSYIRLAFRLRQTQPDVVFAWLGGAIWKALPLAALLTRAKRIAAFRGEVRRNDVGRVAAILRHAVANAHAVTVNAPSLIEVAMRWGAKRDAIAYIPNGVDIPEDRASVTIEPPTAVVVSNFRWYKGHEVLIDALAKIRTPLIVRLIGEGSERTLTQRRAKEAGVDGHVEFVRIPADVRFELSRAQFAIHPSRTEGLSNAILEELSHGLPVVATDVGGTPLLIEDGSNGFLVPPGDSDLLAKRVEELAQSATLRSTMSDAARTKAQEYEWSTCTESYVSLFRALIRQDVAKK